MRFFPDLVIYHGGCQDGFCAAWVIHRYCQEMDVAQPKFIPAKYGDEPPGVTGLKVVIVDFSYPRKDLVRMHGDAESLVVLDHHKTAQEDLAGLEFAKFDMEKSGAGMAWEHFFVSLPPWPVSYVEDRDLWRFERNSSREVNAYLQTVPHDFAAWNRLADSLSWTEVVQAGEAVSRSIDQYVEKMSAQSYMRVVAGYLVPVINAPYVHISELVGHLAETNYFAIGWFKRGDGKYQFSLRSRGEIDVSEIAKSYGGGGHRASAGFVLDTIPYWC